MKNIIFLILISFLGTTVYSQKIKEQSKSAINIPQERIYANYNSSFFLNGEQLLYKIYCFNSSNNTLSNLSKIAYVELIDANLKVCFKHKIVLTSGVGQGDFFIPTILSSGNYKLIAYTKWMLNGSKNNFFQGDISILNPFLDNSNYLSVSENIKSKFVIDNSEINKGEILLSTNKKVFSKREKVILKVKNNKNVDFYGDYSISVRQQDSYEVPNKFSIKNYKTIFKNENLFTNTTNVDYIPEFRGELIYGKIVNKTTKNLISDINISISITGKEYIFKVSKTDENGFFYFNIDQRYNSTTAVLEIDDKNREAYEIILEEQFSIDYSLVNFNDFKLLLKDKEKLIERSVKGQVENAYNTIKQDSIRDYKNNYSFYGSNVYTYLLDDYKRFPTLKETLVEITGHIYYTKRKNNFSIKVLGFDFFYADLKPLLLIDGLQILDHNEISNLKTKNVKKIVVLKDNYIFGTKHYNGVIVLETFKGDYQNSLDTTYRKIIRLFKPVVPKKHFQQEYISKDFSRVPDFRYQLFWKYDFKFMNKENTFNFFTSDNQGKYEATLEGFTKKGKPVSVKTFFEVK